MRKLAAFAFSFSAAIFLSKYLIPESWLPVIAMFSAAAGLTALFFKGDMRLRALLIAFGLSSGFLWNYVYLRTFIEPFNVLDGQKSIITAEVADYPQETEYGVSVYVKLRSEQSRFTAKALLYAGFEEGYLNPGDVIRVEAKINRSSFLYGEETDYYTSKGVFLIAYKKGEAEVIRAPKLPIKYYPQYISKYLKAKISEIYQDDTKPFVMALLTGDKILLNKDVFLMSAMSTAGVSHVVAVSGMHISFLVGLIMLLTRRRRIGALVSVPLVLVFMAVVGNTPSVVRAGIMQLFLLIAPAVKREGDSVTSLSAALMLLLLINPYSAGNIGLQLSFAAIGGIMLLSEKINGVLMGLVDKKHFKSKKFRFIWNLTAATFASSIGALIFTTPLIAMHFNMVSLIAPLSNILILWTVSLAFCGGLISVGLGFLLLPVGKISAYFVSWIVRYIIFIVKWVSGFRFAAVSMLSVYNRIWLAYTYAVILWLYVKRKRGLRFAAPLSSVVLVFCLAILLSGFKTDRAKMTVTAVNVGQGQSVVVTTREHTFVIDCGGDNASNVGINTSDYLWSVNRAVIDVLALTHFDSDHINGVTQLMRRNEVRLLVMPDAQSGNEDSENNREDIEKLAKDMGIEVLYVTENIKLFSGDAALCIFPEKGASGNNDNGLIFLCSAGDYDTLITGDAGSAVERRFINKLSLPQIEVLVVGHHGSKYSTSNELLDAVKPETALISVGYNSYGHPTDEVLSRLRSRAITVYRTDISGNVTVRSN